MFDVRVGSELQYDDVSLADGPVELELEPGTHQPNEITVIGESGHAIKCQPYNTTFCIEVSSGELMDGSTSSRNLFFQEQSVFRVWTPPAVQ